MRNYAEQKKVATPAIWLFFMALLYAVIFIVFFLNAINIDASIAGYRFYDFTDEVQKIDDYDVADGDRMLYIEQGSKVLVKACSVDELAENDVIAFYGKEEGKIVVATRVYKSHESDVDGETTLYITHALDDATLESNTIASGRLLGKYVLAIPKIGLATEYLCSQTWLMWLAIIVLALFMIGIPIVALIIAIKQRKLGSPFPEGVNVNKLKTENLYIYENIKSFILSSGVFKIEKGYDCDLIYLGKVLFGVICCVNGHMYVNINKNFQRYDNKIDRSGYICIPHAANLESAKKRLNSIYRAYFIDKRPMPSNNNINRRPRPVPKQPNTTKRTSRV